ncbi:MAG: Fur family transcriptional regulator [Planctomycetia bacterium]
MARKTAPCADAARAAIRGAGLRCTAARLAVLEHLVTARGPRTHAEVATALADRGFDRATIYRNLTELTEARLVSRMELGDHVWRFELRRPGGQGGRPGEHPHFVCDTCGTVSCLEGVEVAITPKPRATRVGGSPQAGGRRIGAVREVLLKGQCPQCE